MSKGCFKMMYIVRYAEGDSLIEPCPTHNRTQLYIPIKLVLSVDYYESATDWMKNDTCQCQSDGLNEALCTSLKLLPPFPLYKVTVKNKHMQSNQYGRGLRPTKGKTCDYILDPSEHEHMERYLAGTDDPMYDFVHELRHNPRALPTSHELEEAVDKFNKRPRQ